MEGRRMTGINFSKWEWGEPTELWWRRAWRFANTHGAQLLVRETIKDEPYIRMKPCEGGAFVVTVHVGPFEVTFSTADLKVDPDEFGKDELAGFGKVRVMTDHEW
jgi:hypothetical protein